MKIKFLGAAGTVTGSSYVLTNNAGQPVLVDLGMFQGPPDIDRMNYDNYDYNCQNLVGAILTHAHLDHCGRLPILVHCGFPGKIWMTPATAQLAELALIDSAKIAKSDKPKVLYDRDMAEKIIKRFVTTEYHQLAQVGGFGVTMYDAGHILGAASVEIVSDKKIIFSGDLGNSPEDLLMDAEAMPSAEVVVMESTYGDRLHPVDNANEALQKEINTVEQTGGTLLIPAFAMDRTQEILHMIKHLKDEGKVKNETPVYLDSPMAQRATEIHLNFPKLFNDHIQGELRTGNPFDFPGLVETERKLENEASGTKVIIAGGGMMVGGRIVAHAARFLPKASTRLFMVGYQGEGTLGRALQEGERNVVINGMQIQVQGMVTSTSAMSSHADQRQLVEWLGKIHGVKKVILTHGDDGPRTALAAKIQEELGIQDIVMPHMNEEIDV